MQLMQNINVFPSQPHFGFGWEKSIVVKTILIILKCVSEIIGFHEV
jgi:hypothetical protein